MTSAILYSDLQNKKLCINTEDMTNDLNSEDSNTVLRVLKKIKLLKKSTVDLFERNFLELIVNKAITIPFSSGDCIDICLGTIGKLVKANTEKMVHFYPAIYDILVNYLRLYPSIECLMALKIMDSYSKSQTCLNHMANYFQPCIVRFLSFEAGSLTDDFQKKSLNIASNMFRSTVRMNYGHIITAILSIAPTLYQSEKLHVQLTRCIMCMLQNRYFIPDETLKKFMDYWNGVLDRENATEVFISGPLRCIEYALRAKRFLTEWNVEAVFRNADSENTNIALTSLNIIYFSLANSLEQIETFINNGLIRILCNKLRDGTLAHKKTCIMIIEKIATVDNEDLMLLLTSNNIQVLLFDLLHIQNSSFHFEILSIIVRFANFEIQHNIDTLSKLIKDPGKSDLLAEIYDKQIHLTVPLIDKLLSLYL